MNDYEKTLLEMLSYKYPGYLFEFDEYPSMIIVWIKNRSSGFVVRKKITNYKDVSLTMHEIERIIKEMREEELKTVVGWSDKNLIEVKPMSIKKYSIVPKEIIFQDEKTTIINWTDGTKTIVKCSDDDVFSPEAGIALCYMKKFVTDNDSERFHRILKGLVSISKFKNSKQKDESSLSDCAEVIKKAVNIIYALEEKHDNDVVSRTPDGAGNNDSDGSTVEVES